MIRKIEDAAVLDASTCPRKESFQPQKIRSTGLEESFERHIVLLLENDQYIGVVKHVADAAHGGAAFDAKYRNQKIIAGYDK